jgi:hypothetical protein
MCISIVVEYLINEMQLNIIVCSNGVALFSIGDITLVIRRHTKKKKMNPRYSQKNQNSQT